MFGSARYDASRSGEAVNGRALPNVPPPPALTTRLVVRRAAPVLRLPVVAAAQAAANQGAFLPSRGRPCPGTAAGNGGGSPMGLSLGHGSYGTSAGQLFTTTASCDGGLRVDARYGGGTASPSGPLAPSAAASALSRSFSPEPYTTMSVSGGEVLRPLAQPPSPSYNLSPEASRGSVATDGTATGGGGGAGGSRAAAREWRGLERWWQAKGLGDAMIQSHSQPMSAARTVYL